MVIVATAASLAFANPMPQTCTATLCAETQIQDDVPQPVINRFFASCCAGTTCVFTSTASIDLGIKTAAFSVGVCLR